MREEQQHPEHLSERLKQVPEFVKEQFGTVEQQPPNKPSFLFVVLLSGAAIIVIFIIAIFVLHLDGGRLTRERSHKHPTSQLVLPVSPAREA
jgi:hypothetical protein